jgi:hypothetical protein
VLFSKLCKFDGTKTVILSVRDFQQVSGRAGRKGFDDQGTVVVQAPEHVIENKYLEAKAGGDAKKLRKVVKKKPPEKGYLHWDEATFKRLVSSPSEPLVSRFQVTHGMLLNILSRPGDGCRAMQRLVRDSHETATSKRALGRTSFQLFRSLVERNIIEIMPKGSGRKLRVNLDLQADFSLNHALSLYLLDTIKLLDPQSETYALDLLTLCEAIVENPDVILRRQLDRLKTWKMQEMKMAGIEYDERIAELEKLEYPKPNREFIYDTFNQFSATHPWVGTENIRPKLIAREMFEHFLSFDEYIRDYELQRSEGLLLRYLSEVYKVLVQTVPEAARSDETLEMIAYFGAMIRGVDSSLVDEWEKLRNPLYVSPADADQTVEAAKPLDITRDKRAFTALIRNEVFNVVRALAVRDYALVLTLVETTETAASLEAAMAPYYESHQRVDTDRRARLTEHGQIAPGGDGKTWTIKQTLVDPQGHNDWGLDLIVDLERSRAEARPVLVLSRLGAF